MSIKHLAKYLALDIKSISTLLIFFICLTQVKAQSFISEHLFYLLYDPCTSSLADLDNDNDLDLILLGWSGSFYFAENIGTEALPQFNQVKKKPMGNQ